MSIERSEGRAGFCIAVLIGFLLFQTGAIVYQRARIHELYRVIDHRDDLISDHMNGRVHKLVLGQHDSDGVP